MSETEGTVLSKVANYRAGTVNWVGGRLEVTKDRLTFAANGMNAALGNNQRIEVPLAEVREVRYRRGVGTGIVTVVGDRGEVQLRCWGAKAVADTLRQLTGS